MPVRDEKYMLQQRQRIIEAAFRCFARQGFQKTSIRAICKEAGLAVGTLYIHFKDRHEILASMRGIAGEQSIEDVKFQSWEEFVGFLNVIIDLKNNPKSIEYIACDLKLAAEALGNPELASMFKERQKELLRWLKQCLSGFAEQKQIKLPLGVETTACSLRYLINGIITFYQFQNAKEEETLIEDFNKTLRLLVLVQ